MSNKPKVDPTTLTDIQIYNRVEELAREIWILNDVARQRGSIEVPEGRDTCILENVGFYNYWQHPPRQYEWQGSSC